MDGPSMGATAWLVRAGELFGEDAVNEQESVRSATCEAETDVEVLRLHKNDVKAVVGERDDATGEYRQDAEITDAVKAKKDVTSLLFGLLSI